MNAGVVLREATRQDLIEHFVFIGRDSVDAADRFMIFYLPAGNGIEVIRVLHGARDIQRVFAE